MLDVIVLIAMAVVAAAFAAGLSLQAGLPLLNSGAIIGYIVTYVLVFHEFGLGINLPW